MYIYCFLGFFVAVGVVNNVLLAVYFIFILYCGNNVRQKANSSDFLIRDQMGHKAAETTRNINNVFGPGTVNERTLRW